MVLITHSQHNLKLELGLHRQASEVCPKSVWITLGVGEVSTQMGVTPPPLTPRVVQTQLHSASERWALIVGGGTFPHESVCYLNVIRANGSHHILQQ